MRRVRRNPLYWMPLDLDRWLGEVGGALRPEQKGALLDLLAIAWRQTPPCTLPNDAAFLAGRSGLGPTWRKLGAPILAQFQPTADNRLVCPWLREIFAEQMAVYEHRSQAGRQNRSRRQSLSAGATNGAPRGATHGATHGASNSGTTAPPSPVQKLRLEKGEVTTARVLTNPGPSVTATASAAHVETPRAVGSRPEHQPNHKPDHKQLAATYGPNVAANVAASVAEESDERTELHAEYYRVLNEHAGRWLDAHPEQGAAFEEQVRRELALPDGPPRGAYAQHFLHDRVLDLVREYMRWPSSETWVERQLRARYPQHSAEAHRDDFTADAEPDAEPDADRDAQPDADRDESAYPYADERPPQRAQDEGA